MRIIPPKGMKLDLATKLVNDDSFAHMWVCHPEGGKCPDGCDTPANSKRVELYNSIKMESGS